MSIDAIPDNLPDSPFIEGTRLQFAWDSVSLTAGMACWRRYYYKIIEGLVPKGPSFTIALDFGIAFHKAQEHYYWLREHHDHEESVARAIDHMTVDPYYARLPTHTEVMELEAAEADDDASDGITLRNTKVRTRYHLIRAFTWYHLHYEADALRTIKLDQFPVVEASFRIPLPISVAGTSMILCGHLDRGVEMEQTLFVLDYKSTKAISRQFFSSFELAHQMTGYTVAGKILFDKPVAGAIIDGIGLLVGGAKFGRHICTRTEGQIDEYFATVQNTLDEAERHHDEALSFDREAGFLNPIVEQAYPMNTSACYFCEFKELCAKPPEYRQMYKDTLFEPRRAWNPLENR